MPIVKNGDGVIEYLPKSDRFETEETGVHPTDSFQVCAENDQLKQLAFNLTDQTTNTTVTLKSQNATDVVITLPATDTTLAGQSNGFTTFQPDAGTSPTADQVNDTLTLTSSDGNIVITGNSTTDTIDFTADTNVALLDRADQSFSGNVAFGNGQSPLARLHFEASADTDAGGILIETTGSSNNRNWYILPQQNFLYIKNGNTGFFSLVFLSNGRINMGGTSDPGAQLTVTPAATGTSNLILKNIGSQTADSLIIMNSSETPVFSITAAGMIENNNASNETTGAGSAELGANSPATTNSAPYTWLKVKTSDGSDGFIPVWK